MLILWLPDFFPLQIQPFDFIRCWKNQFFFFYGSVYLKSYTRSFASLGYHE